MWDAFVEKSEDATLFHSLVWLELMHDVFQREFEIVCVFDRGRLLAEIPLGFKQHAGMHFATPHVFAPYNHPLIATDVTNEDRAIIINRLQHWIESKFDYAIISTCDAGKFSHMHEWNRHERNTYQIRITTHEEMVHHLHRDVRRRIRIAEKNRLRFSTECEPSMLYTFVKTSYDRHDLLPPISEQKLIEFCPEVCDKNLGELYTVKDISGNVLSAALFLRFRDRFYGSLLGTAADAIPLGATQFLLWNIFSCCIATDHIKTIDLCGGNVPSIAAFHISMGARRIACATQEYFSAWWIKRLLIVNNYLFTLHRKHRMQSMFSSILGFLS